MRRNRRSGVVNGFGKRISSAECVKNELAFYRLADKVTATLDLYPRHSQRSTRLAGYSERSSLCVSVTFAIRLWTTYRIL